MKNAKQVPTQGFVSGAGPAQHDLFITSTLNRVRVQNRFLATLDMMTQTEVCHLLRLSDVDPVVLLGCKEKRGELIRIDRDNQPMYPLFQFDRKHGRVHPVLLDMIDIKPDHWSDIRFCYWLTRSHADFGRPPSELLGNSDDDLMDAYRRAIEPETHG